MRNLRTLTRAQDEPLEVSDTGGGISPEVQDRLFDPFVTTASSLLSLTGLKVLVADDE